MAIELASRRCTRILAKRKQSYWWTVIKHSPNLQLCTPCFLFLKMHKSPYRVQLGSYLDQLQEEIQHTQSEGSSKCMQPPALQIKPKNCSLISLQVRKQKEKNVWTRQKMLRPNSVSYIGKKIRSVALKYSLFFRWCFPHNVQLKRQIHNTAIFRSPWWEHTKTEILHKDTNKPIITLQVY